MKRLLALLLALMMCISLFGCAEGEVSTEKTDNKETTAPTEVENVPSDPEKESEPEVESEPEKESEPEVESEPEKESEPEVEYTGATPLLYKVSDDAGNVVWLFGSIHVGWEEYYPLPDYVQDAFDSSEALAVEFDVIAFEQDYDAMIEAMTSLIYLDGTDISDHIPEDLYDRAVAILEAENSYSSLLDMYLPVMWSTSIDNFVIPYADADAELGIDKYMINLAYDCDKPVLDVESPALQYGMLAGFSEELQIFMLESSVEGYENMDEYIEELQELMTAWMEGDEETLIELVSTSYDTEDPDEQALIEEYNYAMLESRNQGMAEFAMDALEDGEEIFICVGTAHIVGEGALVELLREQGYTVELVR